MMTEERTDKNFRAEKTERILRLPEQGGVDGAASRRTGHGSLPWLPQAATQLRQPQDGASTEQGSHANPRRLSPVRTSLHNPLLRSLVRSPNLRHVLEEPEDAGLTGGTRSLTRRVLGLNGVAKSGAAAPAARMNTQRAPGQGKSAGLVRLDPRAQIA
jgi:hypothetical protein